eukprot:3118290-Prymnesium_polylepis.1
MPRSGSQPRILRRNLQRSSPGSSKNQRSGRALFGHMSSKSLLKLSFKSLVGGQQPRKKASSAAV